MDSRLRGNDIARIGFDILGDKAKVGWQNFVRVWDELVGVGTSRPAELVRAILDMGYGDYLEAEYMDSRDRRGDVEQLVVFAGKFSDLGEFLAETCLAENYRQATEKDGAASLSYSPSPIGSGTGSQRGGDNYPPPSGGRKQERSSGKIILSTVHQAKGLEWSAVFVVNLASGAFPNSRAAVERGGIEEERRLFYVAITRAKKNLFLTYPMQSGFPAQGGPASGWGDTLPGPSMFLEEIDSELLDDKSLLGNGRSLALNDTEIEYVDENAPIKIRPGSFLRDVEDL